MRNGLWLFSISLICFAFFTFGATEKNNLFSVHYFDVGQGDSAMLRTPNDYRVLIDGGPDKKVLAELSKILPANDKKIDLIILTHPHADHLNGLMEVIKSHKVNAALIGGAYYESKANKEFMKLLKEKKIKTTIADKDKDFELDGIFFDILYPFDEYFAEPIKNINNASIVLKVIHGKNAFLFTGDAEKEVEYELLKSEANLKTDVLKVGHHGSKTSSDINFLRAVEPKIAIISVGAKNKYGHPSRQTLLKFLELKIKVLRTDLIGSINIFSNGEKIFAKKTLPSLF